MKKNMKVMQIYEIQKNYQRHRTRVTRINTTQADQHKPSLHNNMLKINNYKRKKIEVNNFNQKERMDRIYTDNQCLRQKLIRLTLRENSLLRQSRIKGSPHSSSLRQILANPQIRSENMKMKQRMLKTRSNYCRLDRSSLKRESTREQIHQKEVIHLLQKQLGITPTVTFPNVRKIVSQQRKYSLPACDKSSIPLVLKAKDNHSVNRSTTAKKYQ